MTRERLIQARQDERFEQALEDYYAFAPADGISETLTGRERAICDRLVKALEEATPVALLHSGLTPVPHEETYNPDHMENPMSGLSGRDLFVAMAGPLFDLLEAADPGITDRMSERLLDAWVMEARRL